MATAGLAFDLVILIVLVVTIFQAVRLSGKFERMQADRKAFETLIQALNLATARAEGAVSGLKKAALENGDGLQEKINKGRELADELEIMIQAGDSLADRLKDLAEKGRRAVTEKPARQSDEGAARVEPSAAVQPRTRAEKELIDALRTKKKP